MPRHCGGTYLKQSMKELPEQYKKNALYCVDWDDKTRNCAESTVSIPLCPVISKNSGLSHCLLESTWKVEIRSL